MTPAMETYLVWCICVLTTFAMLLSIGLVLFFSVMLICMARDKLREWWRGRKEEEPEPPYFS